MKLINGFLCGALTLLSLSGCGGGGSDSSSNIPTSQRILNQGIAPATSDGVYQVSSIERIVTGTEIVGSQSLTITENTGIETVFVDFGSNQISLAFSDYIDLDRENSFFSSLLFIN